MFANSSEHGVFRYHFQKEKNRLREFDTLFFIRNETVEEFPGIAAIKPGNFTPSSCWFSRCEFSELERSPRGFKPAAQGRIVLNSELFASPTFDSAPLEGLPTTVAITLDVVVPTDTNAWAGVKWFNADKLTDPEQGDGSGLKIKSNGELVVFNGTESFAAQNILPASTNRVEIRLNEGTMSLFVNDRPALFADGKSTLPYTPTPVHFLTLAAGSKAGSTAATVLFDNVRIATDQAIPPKLTITQVDATNMAISWYDPSQQFQLQTKSALSAEVSWESPGLSLQVENGLNTVTDPVENITTKFYRLIKF